MLDSSRDPSHQMAFLNKVSYTFKILESRDRTHLQSSAGRSSGPILVVRSLCFLPRSVVADSIRLRIGSDMLVHCSSIRNSKFQRKAEKYILASIGRIACGKLMAEEHSKEGYSSWKTLTDGLAVLVCHPSSGQIAKGLVCKAFSPWRGSWIRLVRSHIQNDSKL